MAKESKIFAIDDAEFELTQLGGVEGVDLFDRLTAELGAPVMSSVIAALQTKDPEGALGMVALGAIVKLPADFKQQLRVRFSALSRVKAGNIWLALGDGKSLEIAGTFDQHFAGRFGHMTKWLIACLKWSFVDFLPSSPGSGSTSPTGTTSASASPAGLNWFVWRVATHERTRASLIEIQTQWSLGDLIDAHLALDVHDELQRRLHERLKRT